MGLLKEFKEFAYRGNFVDMAVGIIIGTAFSKIVSSFVGDVIMPPIGVLLGGVNFSDLSILIKEATSQSPAVVIKYGAFIQTIIDFLIIAFCMFIIVKAFNALQRKKEEEVESAPPKPSPQEELLRAIRDLLKERTLR